MQGQPAEGKDQHQAENSLGHFPALKTKPKKKNQEEQKVIETSSLKSHVITRLHRSAPELFYLFHVVIECNAHDFFATEHLTGHECVEDGRTGQREAEVETKQPPVLGLLVQLEQQQVNR